MDAYGHVQKLDMTFFEDRSTGGRAATLNDGINQLELFLNGGANMLIPVFSTVIRVGRQPCPWRATDNVVILTLSLA